MDEQNNINMNPNPVPNTGMDMGGVSKHSSIGATIGIIIILAVVILGGLYFWGAQNSGDLETNQMMMEIETQGSTDDLNAIEADLDNTNIEILDAEINAS